MRKVRMEDIILLTGDTVNLGALIDLGIVSKKTNSKRYF